MLLSEALKKYYNKQLFEKFNGYSLLAKYNAQYKNQKLYRTRKYVYNNYERLSFILNEWRYNVDFNGKISDELMQRYNSKEFQQKLLYIKEQKTLYPNFVSLLLNIYPIAHVALDQISNDQFEIVPLDKVRSKKYQNYILFWENNEGELFMGSYNNTINYIITKEEQYFCNDNYVPENLNNILRDNPDYNQQLINLINRIYIKKPVYKCISDSNEIKAELGSEKILNIVNMFKEPKDYHFYNEFEKCIIKGGLKTIYGISLELLQTKFRNKEEIERRDEYNEYIEKNAKLIKERYKYFVTFAQSIRISRKFQVFYEKINNTINLCNTYNKELLEISINQISTGKEYTGQPSWKIGAISTYIPVIQEYIMKIVNKCVSILQNIKKIEEANAKIKNFPYNDVIYTLSTLRININEYNDLLLCENSSKILGAISNIQSLLTNYNVNNFRQDIKTNIIEKSAS